MSRPCNPDLIDALKLSLKQIEDSGQLTPNDPTVLRLKRFILLAISELESKERGDGAAA